MLITENEINFLPSYQSDSEIKGIHTILWQHNQDCVALLDYARLHYPLLQLDGFKDLKPKRFRERLSTSILVNHILGPHAQIEHKGNGAPYVNEKDIILSISHTKNIYAISLSHIQHGIDVEQWSDKAYRIKSKFLNSDEQNLLDSLNILQSKEKRATMLWSAKEAVYKCFDIAGLEFLKDIYITVTNGKLFVHLPQYNKFGEIYITEYPDCVLTCCKAID